MVFSMLLSPEITASAGGLAERRDITLRTEDVVLLVIGFSWFAKTAVNKELGLVAKTPLNRPIIAYIAVNLVATLLGYLMGSVQTAAGYLDRKSTRLNSSHGYISYAVFCLKKKREKKHTHC